jgi:regulator of sigma E protease
MKSEDGVSVGDEQPEHQKALTVTLPACKMRTLGMTMKVGPIAGVRQGTPADLAGLRVGDELRSINGQEIEDVFTLQQRLLQWVGDSVEVVFERDGRKQSRKLVPELPRTYGEPLFYGAMLPIESLGVALPVHNIVVDVDPDGPAGKAGVEIGDEIITVQMVLEDEQQRALAMEVFPGYQETIFLDYELPYWQYVHALVQHSVPGTSLRLGIVRDGAAAADGGEDGAAHSGIERSLTVMVTPRESDQYYCASRGLILESLSGIRTAQSWKDAVILGVRETSDQIHRFSRLLYAMLTGWVASEHVGGPISIAGAGAVARSRGLEEVLLFLSLVSITQGLVCLLPIPGLDGGHLAFLAAEGIRGAPVKRRTQATIILVSVGGFLLLRCTLCIACLSQLIRLIGLLRKKKASLPDEASE